MLATGTSSLLQKSLSFLSIPTYSKQSRYLFHIVHKSTKPNAVNRKIYKLTSLQARHLNGAHIQNVATTFDDVPAPTFGVNLSQISFTNTQSIYASTTTSDLAKSGLMLSSMRFKLIYQNASFLLDLSKKIFGKQLTLFVIRYTLFQHFTGGESLNDLLKTGEALSKRGIGTIVDYAAESCDDSSSVLSTTWLDNNVKLTQNGIVHSGKLRDLSKNDFAFLALKVTSMCRPQLCRKITSCLNFFHSLFSTAVHVDEKLSYYNPMNHDILCDKTLSLESMTALLESIWPTSSTTKNTTTLSKKNIQTMVNEMSKLYSDKFNNPSSISYIQFMSYFTPEKIATLPPPYIKSDKKMTNSLKELYWLKKDDAEEWDLACKRLDECFELAKEHNVRLLVDAEQTFFQSAIDYIAMRAMEKYSQIPHSDQLTQTPALSYNTYQLYLKNSLGKLKYEMKRANILGYRLGAKVVRGAYISQETHCATENQYECPIHDSIEGTHTAFDTSIEHIISHLPEAELLCATHNEKSVTKAARHLGELAPKNPKAYPVTFGQLYGMCDYMSLQLARAGARTNKYVPYGPIDLVLPYLVRRAEENSSIFGSATKEARLVWKEVNRRLLTSLGVI